MFACIYFPKDISLSVIRRTHRDLTCQTFEAGEKCRMKWKGEEFDGDILKVGDKEVELKRLANNLSRDVLQKTETDDPLPALFEYIKTHNNTTKASKKGRQDTQAMPAQKAKKPRTTVSFMDMLQECQPGGTNLIDTWKLINQDDDIESSEPPSTQPSLEQVMVQLPSQISTSNQLQSMLPPLQSTSYYPPPSLTQLQSTSHQPGLPLSQSIAQQPPQPLPQPKSILQQPPPPLPQSQSISQQPQPPLPQMQSTSYQPSPSFSQLQTSHQSQSPLPHMLSTSHQSPSTLQQMQSTSYQPPPSSSQLQSTYQPPSPLPQPQSTSHQPPPSLPQPQPTSHQSPPPLAQPQSTSHQPPSPLPQVQSTAYQSQPSFSQQQSTLHQSPPPLTQIQSTSYQPPPCSQLQSTLHQPPPPLSQPQSTSNQPQPSLPQPHSTTHQPPPPLPQPQSTSQQPPLSLPQSTSHQAPPPLPQLQSTYQPPPPRTPPMEIISLLRKLTDPTVQEQLKEWLCYWESEVKHQTSYGSPLCNMVKETHTQKAVEGISDNGPVEQIQQQTPLAETPVILRRSPRKRLCLNESDSEEVKSMPADEAFSFDYKWDIVKTKAQLILTSKIVMLNSGNWESLAHLKNVYTKEIFCEPWGTKRWSNDLFFGHQRIASMNHSCIALCEKIPDKLGVTDEMLKPFLEGWTLDQVIEAKRLFIVDHDILTGLPCRDGFCTCDPVALFFVNGNHQLVPIAIQLYQNKAPDNPIFLPTDPPYVWMLAKMWFNNADANVHQSLTHLAFTHLLMEGVTVITHRNLSQSHPVFKLLAPHFLYLIAINTRGLELLVSPNGWVDKVMNIGIKGMFALIARGINKWRMDVEGTLPEDLKRRGLYNHKILPGYHFRDDAILLYDAIHKYVTKYVDLYYDTEDKITGDWELQAWGAELVKEREEGGCGLLGVPANGKFSTKKHLYLTLTSIVYTCSVGHASTNFPQYDEYAFPPNYPPLMQGVPPKDKKPCSEDVVLKALPDKPTTLDVMIVTKILSQRGTRSLGDFEVQYIFEPEARKIVDEFRDDLAAISKTIKERNKERNPPYPFLDPDIVPNSISI